ncbi:hypothetical protein N9901_00105 [Flavobacteriaceae bacterium]|nr:hypothetical protein [Flavobacteriaceae bacterium]
MKNHFSSIVTYILIILSGSAVVAQENQVSSLLSNIGLGVEFAEATVEEKGQGNLNVVGNNTEEVVSFANPALLSDLQMTSFGITFQSLGAKTQSPDATVVNTASSIANLSIGLPLGLKGGFAAGLRINSATGFEIDTEDTYNSGAGTVNHMYAGIGYRVFNGLSLGAQTNVYFGKSTKTQVFRKTQQSTVLLDDYNVSGVATKIGMQYQELITRKLVARIGAYTVLEHSVTATGTNSFYEAVESSENTFTQRLNGAITTTDINGTQVNATKSVFGLGVGERNMWFAGLQYETQGATSYTGSIYSNQVNSTNLNIGLEDRSKINLGGYIIPKKYALKNYLNRVAYRAGFKYETTGLLLNNNSVKNIGMTFGLGLPIGNKVSYANISVEIGRLGDFSKNNYQEEYLNVGVNFTLSDKWFKKRVID